MLRDEVEDMQQQLERLQKGSVVVFQKEPPEVKEAPLLCVVLCARGHRLKCERGGVGGAQRTHRGQTGD